MVASVLLVVVLAAVANRQAVRSHLRADRRGGDDRCRPHFVGPLVRDLPRDRAPSWCRRGDPAQQALRLAGGDTARGFRRKQSGQHGLRSPARSGASGGSVASAASVAYELGSCVRGAALDGGVEGGAERPESAVGGRGAVLGALGCDELWRAVHDSGAGELHADVVEDGETEVGEHDAAVVGEQDVAGLDVAVQYAGVMRGGERVEDGEPDLATSIAAAGRLP